MQYNPLSAPFGTTPLFPSQLNTLQQKQCNPNPSTQIINVDDCCNILKYALQQSALPQCQNQFGQNQLLQNLYSMLAPLNSYQCMQGNCPFLFVAPNQYQQQQFCNNNFTPTQMCWDSGINRILNILQQQSQQEQQIRPPAPQYAVTFHRDAQTSSTDMAYFFPQIRQTCCDPVSACVQTDPMPVPPCICCCNKTKKVQFSCPDDSSSSSSVSTKKSKRKSRKKKESKKKKKCCTCTESSSTSSTESEGKGRKRKLSDILDVRSYLERAMHGCSTQQPQDKMRFFQ